MESLKQQRSRIASLRATEQLTRAMELVASARLYRARQQMEAASAYARVMTEAMEAICAAQIAHISGENEPFFLVLAGDRGLAGDYYSRLFRLAQQQQGHILALGRKAEGLFAQSRPLPQTREAWFQLGRELAEHFLRGEMNALHVVSTRCHAGREPQPQVKTLLPLPAGHGTALFEPSPEAVLEAALPEYLGAEIWAARTEAETAEQTCRRLAMDTASRNASDLAEELRRAYDRARQETITRELTELAAGLEN